MAKRDVTTPGLGNSRSIRRAHARRNRILDKRYGYKHHRTSSNEKLMGMLAGILVILGTISAALLVTTQR